MATDRGNGTVNVTGTNTLTVAGDGSPCIYSTGDISVSGATAGSSSSATVALTNGTKVTGATSGSATVTKEGTSSIAA